MLSTSPYYYLHRAAQDQDFFTNIYKILFLLSLLSLFYVYFSQPQLSNIAMYCCIGTRVGHHVQ